MSDEAKMTLLKVGAEFCGPCIALAKAKTLEKFVDKHKNVALRVLTVADKDGESPDNTQYAEHDIEANRHDVRALPTIIFLDAEGVELARVESGLNAKELEQLYAKALKRADKTKRRVVAKIAEDEEDDDDDDGNDDDESEETDGD